MTMPTDHPSLAADAPSLVLLVHPPRTRRLSLLCGHLRRLGYLVVDERAAGSGVLWDYVVPDVVLVRLERASGPDADSVFARVRDLRRVWPGCRFLVTAERKLSSSEQDTVAEIGSTVLYHPRFALLAQLLYVCVQAWSAGVGG